MIRNIMIRMMEINILATTNCKNKMDHTKNLFSQLNYDLDPKPIYFEIKKQQHKNKVIYFGRYILLLCWYIYLFLWYIKFYLMLCQLLWLWKTGGLLLIICMLSLCYLWTFLLSFDQYTGWYAVYWLITSLSNFSSSLYSLIQIIQVYSKTLCTSNLCNLQAVLKNIFLNFMLMHLQVKCCA